VSSIAIVSYQKILDMSREKVCTTNQQALTNAVEAYVTTNYAIPAVLGDLKRRDLEKGYAKAMAEGGWTTRLAHFIVRTSMSSEAYAQFLTYDNLKSYGVSKDFFRCPSDPNGGTSYGINANIAGKAWKDIADNVLIVADCDSPTFSSQGDLRARHGSGRIAIAVTKGQSVTRFETASATGAADVTDVAFDDDGNDYDIDDDSFDDVNTELQDIFDTNTGTLKSAAQQVMNMLDAAKTKAQTGDMTGALTDIEGAIDIVQTTIDDGLLDSTQGTKIIDNLESRADVIRNL
jgi:hypothetical protein